MKFCTHQILEESRHGKSTVYHYVRINDIKNFHGKQFFQQFEKFISEKLKPAKFGNDEGYYLIDYQFYAQRTKLWLES